MLKKTMLLAGVVAALTALVVPAMANASARNWQHNDLGLTGPVNITTHGTAAFTSDQGGVSCPTTASITLEPGSTGKVTAFAPSVTSGCSYSGALDTLCGVVDTHASTGLPWTVHATKFSNGTYGINITGVDADVGGTGIFCPDVTVSGTAIATGDPHGGKTLHLEGTLSSNITKEVFASGTQEITPASTYKIAT